MAKLTSSARLRKKLKIFLDNRACAAQPDIICQVLPYKSSNQQNDPPSLLAIAGSY